jgi:hypothetical protein
MNEREGPARSCASCQAAIVDRYYALGAKLLCAPCHARVAAAADARLASGSFGAALLRGGGAALLGAVISYTFGEVTNIHNGIVAVLIGYLVGRGVAQGSKGKGGLGYQTLALGLTYLSIALTFVPETYRAAQHLPHGGLFTTLALSSFVLSRPFLISFESPLTGIIHAFALYEAWKLNRAVRLPITGPHAVNAPAAHAG